MRLTELMKDRIGSTVINAMFASREEELDRREEMLGLAIRDAQMTRDEWENMEALPAKFFTSGRQSHVNVTQQRETGSNLYHRINYPPEVRIPDYMDQGRLQLDDLPPELQQEFRAYIEARKSFAAEREDFEKQTRGVIGSFGTSEKLLEAWPTLRELMPEGYFVPKPKPALPITTINTLDAALQATRPFETEKEAA